jgi:ferrous-iron efflux pump FieF
VDAAASIATFVGVRYAEQPDERDHRWGHGKGEAIAALMQSLFLAGAALALVLQSGYRLLHPRPLEEISIGLWIVLGSTVAAAALVGMQSWVVRKTGSTAIAADRAHYLSDVAVNIAVLAALGVTTLTRWEYADPLFALAIAGYMLWNSRGIALTALRLLLDRELEVEKRRNITEIVLACPGVRAIHDLRTRDAGDRVFRVPRRG